MEHQHNGLKSRANGSTTNGYKRQTFNDNLKMEQEPLLSSSTDKQRLLSHDESKKLLPWQTDNDYILTGYRRELHSVSACLWSAVGYLHNETVNIHTHSLGALFFAILIPLHLIPTHLPSFSLPFVHAPRGHPGDTTPIPASWEDKLYLTWFLCCSVGTLTLSSSFHTLQCHSRELCNKAHIGDYIGIVLEIVGTALAAVHYGFYDHHILQAFYSFAIIAAGVASAYIVLSPRGRTERVHRTITFLALGLSSIIPVIHNVALYGFAHARQSFGLDFFAAGGAAYIFGAILYAARIPERFSPGTFDYFGASHQIFHCFVLCGAALHYAAIRTMIWGRSAV